MNKSALDILYLLRYIRSSLFFPSWVTLYCNNPTTKHSRTTQGKMNTDMGQNGVRTWVPALLWKKHMSLQHQAPIFPLFKVPTNVFSTPVPLNIPPLVLCWWEVHCKHQSCIFSFFMSNMEELIVLLMFFLIYVTVGSLFINSFLCGKGNTCIQKARCYKYNIIVLWNREGNDILKPTFHKSVSFLEWILGHAEASSKISIVFWNAQ